MRRIQHRNLFFLAFAALLILAGCRSKVIIDEPKTINVSINAPKAKVFEAATLTFIKGGFTILVANDAVGLLTTEFKRVDVGFQEAFHLALAEEISDNPEVQFSTNIIESGGRSVLTMVAKGRVWTKKGYQYYIFKEEFMNAVRAIGEQIKVQAEAK